MYLTCPVSERSLISAIYNYGNSAYYEVSDILSADSFNIETNQVLFKCLKYLIEKDENVKPDIPSIYSVAKELGVDCLINNRETHEHIRACISLQVNTSNTRMFAKKVRKLHILRILKRKLDATSNQVVDFTGEESVEEIMSIGENAFLDFGSMLGDDGSPILMGQDIEEFIQNIIDGDGSHLGISTGYPILNSMLGGGLEPGTLSVIGSRTGVGKSFLAANISLHIAGKLGVNVLHIDTEMEKEPQTLRCLAIQSGVSLDKIKYNKMTAKEQALVKEAGKQIAEMPYYYKNVSDKPVFEEHASIIRRWVQSTVGFEKGTTKAKPAVVCYDYLKMLSDKSLQSDMKEFQVLGFCCTTLANLSVTLNLPILSFSQTNRDGISKEDLSIMSASDRISWLCSNVVLFKEKTDEEISEDLAHNGTHKMVVLKSRHGCSTEWGNYINFTLDKKNRTGRITEIGTRSDMLEEDKNEGFISEEVPFD